MRCLSGGQQRSQAHADPHFCVPHDHIGTAAVYIVFVVQIVIAALIPGILTSPPHPVVSMSNPHSEELLSTARRLVAPGKGILAADESTSTAGKRVRCCRKPSMLLNGTAKHQNVRITSSTLQSLNIRLATNLGHHTAVRKLHFTLAACQCESAQHRGQQEGPQRAVVHFPRH